jgi:hypothetical protein
LFSSACVEVESAFKVLTNSSEDMNSLIFSFQLILGLREFFSVVLTTTTVNKGLSLQACCKIRFIILSIVLEIIHVVITTIIRLELLLDS